MEKVWFHVDLDAFFASVEQRDNPQYRGKPVIIGGVPGSRRTVVSTASYEARKFGVHSAMPISKAYQLCPQGIYIPGNYQKYQEVSSQIMDIFQNYSPTVLQISIDEAFLDMTGTERLFGPAERTAMMLKDEVKEKTGLTVSVGVSRYMYISKIASGFQKPDGLTYVPCGEEENFMLNLPLEKLWGVGAKTQDRLKNMGFRTTRSIYEKSLGLLQSIFGENMGSMLYNSVRGNKDLQFGWEAKNHSISAETTYDYDLTDLYTVETAIMELCHHVLFRMHKENVRSRSVALKIRFEDFSTITVQETSSHYISNADDMFERCRRLLAKKYDPNRGIRLLGVGVQNVEDKSTPVQAELFDFGESKRAKLDNAIFSLEDKDPSLKIVKARVLKKD